MTKDKSTADVVVDLQNEEFDRRVLSVDPDTGKVREVEIGLQVRFSVRTGGGELIHPSETLNWEQDFVFDENSVLGTVEQETRLRVNLAQDAARTIMVKLETLKLPTP
jgi:outer membrane lipopolysaccharide assembly protein LptE/RlpB